MNLKEDNWETSRINVSFRVKGKYARHISKTDEYVCSRNMGLKKAQWKKLDVAGTMLMGHKAGRNKK